MCSSIPQALFSWSDGLCEVSAAWLVGDYFPSAPLCSLTMWRQQQGWESPSSTLVCLCKQQGKGRGRQGKLFLALLQQKGGVEEISSSHQGVQAAFRKVSAYLWQRGVELKNLPFSLYLAHAYLTGQVHSAGREALQSEATVEVPLWTAPHLLKGKLLHRDEEKIYSSVGWKTF